MLLELAVVVLLVPGAIGAHVFPKAEAFLKPSMDDPLITSKVVAAADAICAEAV